MRPPKPHTRSTVKTDVCLLILYQLKHVRDTLLQGARENYIQFAHCTRMQCPEPGTNFVLREYFHWTAHGGHSQFRGMYPSVSCLHGEEQYSNFYVYLFSLHLIAYYFLLVVNSRAINPLLCPVWGPSCAGGDHFLLPLSSTRSSIISN